MNGKASARGFVTLAAALVPCLCAGFAAADGTRPWSEAAVPVHVDQRRFGGVLPLDRLQALADRGEALFTARFTSLDGAGRPLATQAIVPTKRRRPAQNAFQRLAGPDASACSSCHNDPVTGGAGDFVTNAFVSEGFVNADFDSTDPQFSNERNTNHLMGAGLVELLAREMTADLRRLRTEALREARASGEPVTVRLSAKGVGFGELTAHADGAVDLSGVEGVDGDLVIRPFGQKGVIGSLRQFSVNALNHHHGMQAVERFGTRWTGEDDFDGDGIGDELTVGDVSALVAWQATRPPPTRPVPVHAEWRRMAEQGEKRFMDIGCGVCHRPALALDSLAFDDPGPLDAAGTLRPGESAHGGAVYDLSLLEWARSLPRDAGGAVLVPLFGDLKRHRIADRKAPALGNELLAQRFVDRDVFITAELWGIASTAPYGHRGDMTTLDEAIRAHGGDARQARDRYIALAGRDRDALIAFLKTLAIAP